MKIRYPDWLIITIYVVGMTITVIWGSWTLLAGILVLLTANNLEQSNKRGGQ